MKVCIINSLYKPDGRGGAEIVAAKQTRMLREQGHQVFVVSTRARRRIRSNQRFEMIDNVRVYRVAAWNLFSFLAYGSKPLWQRLIWLGLDMCNLAVAWQVAKILRQEKPDAVYTHNIRGLSYLLPRLLKYLNIKHTHHLHDIQLAYPSGLLIKGHERDWVNGFFLRSWYEGACRWLFGSPDKVVAPSQWLLDFYTERNFFRKSDRTVIRPEFKIEKINFSLKGKLKLLYVGQMEEHKGVLFLIDALKSLQLATPSAGLPAQDRLDFQLDIAGSGSALEKAKKLAGANNNFIFHGQAPNEAVGRLYEQADITVVPSLTYENAPRVIIESLSHGTPVLATRLGGIPEMIKEGQNGWLFEAGDMADFLAKVKHICQSGIGIV